MKLFLTVRNPYTGEPFLVEAEGVDYPEAQAQLACVVHALSEARSNQYAPEDEGWKNPGDEAR